MDTDDEKLVVVEFKTASGKDLKVKEETFLAASQWLDDRIKDLTEVEPDDEEDYDSFMDDSVFADGTFEIEPPLTTEEIENTRPNLDINKTPTIIRSHLPSDKTPTMTNFFRGTPVTTPSAAPLQSPAMTSEYGFPTTPMIKIESNPKANKRFTPLTIPMAKRAQFQKLKQQTNEDRKRKNTEDLEKVIQSLESPCPKTVTETPQTPKLTDDQRKRFQDNQELLRKRRSLALEESQQQINMTT